MALTVWHTDMRGIGNPSGNFVLPVITDPSVLIIFGWGSGITSATGCTLDHTSGNQIILTRLVTSADSMANITVTNIGPVGYALLALISGGEQVKPPSFASSSNAANYLSLNPPALLPLYPVVRFLAHKMINSSYTDNVVGFTKVADYSNLVNNRFTLWKDTVTYPAGANTPITALSITKSTAQISSLYYVAVYDIGGFIHLDIDTDGCYKIRSAGSGYYLRMAADGTEQRVSGTEGSTALILDTDGTIKVKGP